MSRLRFVGSMLVVGLLTSGFLMGEDKKPDAKETIFIKARLPAGYSKLGLSDKQKKKIYETRATYAAQIEKLQQQIADLREKEKMDVENVLTEGQKARLKEIRSGGKTKEVSDKPSENKKP
jgi:hypothetical protein